MSNNESIDLNAISVTYNEMMDDIDYLIENDTTLKGVMYQRLLACRAWFAEQLKMERLDYTIGKVEFAFAPDKPIPAHLSKMELQSAIVPVLEDKGVMGKIVYQGFDIAGGYHNYYLSGMCPNHKRVHDGQAWKWVLKVKNDKSFAGFKCWRNESFYKICCIEQLLP